MKLVTILAAVFMAPTAWACNGVTGKYSCTMTYKGGMGDIRTEKYDMEIVENTKTSLTLLVEGESTTEFHDQEEVEDGITIKSTCTEDGFTTEETAGNLRAYSRTVISKKVAAISGTEITTLIQADGKPIRSVEKVKVSCVAAN